MECGGYDFRDDLLVSFGQVDAWPTYVVRLHDFHYRVVSFLYMFYWMFFVVFDMRFVISHS